MTRMSLPLSMILGAGLAASTAPAEDTVGVPGGRERFPKQVTKTIGDEEVALVLTGTAMRTKYFFNIYAVASYVKAEASVRTARELAAGDLPKELVLVMERGVSAKDMSAAIAKSISANHSPKDFKEAYDAFIAFLRGNEIRKGDRVRMTHIPGVGMRCRIGKRASITLQDLKFARAVWDIYLGPKNLGEHIKKGLVSRLQ